MRAPDSQGRARPDPGRNTRGGLSRVRGTVARAREWLPLTNLGVAVAAIAAAAYWGFARPHADYAIALVALLALGLVGLAVLGVLAGAGLLARRLRRLAPPEEELAFEAVRGFAYGLTLPGWRALPMLELTWTWEAPEGFEVELTRAAGRISEALTAPRRVRTERVARRFEVEDGFGLARVVLRHTERRSVRVLPFLGRLDQAPLLESLTAGDDLPHPRGLPEGDRVDMRRYVPGDPLRLALWKVFARTRQLMVRTPERALAPSVRVVAYLPSAFADEPAAAAARWAVERGAFGDDWCFGGDGTAGCVTSVPEALERIVETRSVRGTPRGDAAGLGAFLEQTEGEAQARVVLFLPGAPGPWLSTVTGILRARHRNVTCVVVVDGFSADAEPEPLAARARRVLKRPLPASEEDEARVTREAFSKVAGALRAAGAQVVALDRAAGRMLPVGGGAGLDGAYAQALTRGGQAA